MRSQKKSWSYIEKVRRDQTRITLLQSDGNPVTSYNSLDKAELLNQQLNQYLLMNLQATYQTIGP